MASTVAAAAVAATDAKSSGADSLAAGALEPRTVTESGAAAPAAACAARAKRAEEADGAAGAAGAAGPLGPLPPRLLQADSIPRSTDFEIDALATTPSSGGYPAHGAHMTLIWTAFCLRRKRAPRPLT
jgi:hypothetical protein